MGFFGDFGGLISGMRRFDPHRPTRNRHDSEGGAEKFAKQQRKLGLPDPRQPRGAFEARSTQKFLPDFLRTATGKRGERPTEFGRSLSQSLGLLSQLFTNPGGINPELSQAIAPLLALQSQSIARQSEAELASAQGSLARAGLGSSGIKGALEAAIQRAGNRDIASTRMQAILQSEQLRRDDLARAEEMMRFLADFGLQAKNVKAGKKAQAASRDASREQASAQKTAATVATIGSIVAAFSDERLKFNLRPYQWEWGSEAPAVGLRQGVEQAGLLAQDVEAVWPDAVVERNGYKAVDYQLVAARLAAMLQASREA